MISTPNGQSVVVDMLLLMHMIALGVGLMLFGWMFYLQRRARRQLSQALPLHTHSPAGKFHRLSNTRPTKWLAIRSVSPEAVKDALGLNHASPCSWSEGLVTSHAFFIGPRLNGWVIVTGMALPDPSEDVDECYVFLCTLSRKLGHLQYFHANTDTRHHAWARLDDGCVTRAFAWAGTTLWNQGVETLPEIEAGLKTPDYGDATANQADIEANVVKISKLASRWSLDPAGVRMTSIRESIGLAGESAMGESF